MARCMANTSKGKKCGNSAVAEQTFCSLHLKDKSKAGRSRRLTQKKCEKLRSANKSPYSHKILSPRSRTYGQIYTACRKGMHSLADRLEKQKDLPASLDKLAKDIKVKWVRARLGSKKVKKAMAKKTAKKVVVKKAVAKKPAVKKVVVAKKPAKKVVVAKKPERAIVQQVQTAVLDEATRKKYLKELDELRDQEGELREEMEGEEGDMDPEDWDDMEKNHRDVEKKYMPKFKQLNVKANGLRVRLGMKPHVWIGE